MTYYVLAAMLKLRTFWDVTLCCLVGMAQSVSDSLRAGRSEDRISVGRGFPHPSRPDLGPIEAPAQWVPDLFPRGTAAGAWLSPPPPSAEVKERIDLYLYPLAGSSWLVLR